MAKMRIETDFQYIGRTVAPESVSVLISGSTTSAGILGYTHSLGVAPKHVFVSAYGSNNYVAKVGTIGSSGIDLYFFTGSSAANAAAVTASLYIRPY